MSARTTMVLGGSTLALASALVLGSGSIALGCVGGVIQDSDCVYYYGPVDQSPYKDMALKPGTPGPSQGSVNQSTQQRSAQPGGDFGEGGQGARAR